MNPPAPAPVPAPAQEKPDAIKFIGEALDTVVCDGRTRRALDNAWGEILARLGAKKAGKS